MGTKSITRRTAGKALLAGAFSAPFVYRAHASAPSETVYHASFGAGGMASSDIASLSTHKHLKLVAVADVDTKMLDRAQAKYPGIKVYSDWRELLEKEKTLNSVNVSTPDHMHAAIGFRSIQNGLHAYIQKPLTQTILESRRLTEIARQKAVVTQMGIQGHSGENHKTIAKLIQSGIIGSVRAVHSWSGKKWGDLSERPSPASDSPGSLNWDHWLGVATERPFIGNNYYHPSNWRKRLDFGTGTFGDMGCHILDPVFNGLQLQAPLTLFSTGGSPNSTNWGLDSQVRFTFNKTAITTDDFTLTWYDGDRRPPQNVQKLIDGRAYSDQGSIFIGTDGVMYCPYGGRPILFPQERYRGKTTEIVPGDNHYHQFVEACRGNGKTSTPFDYSGMLTEAVLLGCLATRFPEVMLKWNSDTLQFMDNKDATRFVTREYRKGWEIPGL